MFGKARGGHGYWGGWGDDDAPTSIADVRQIVTAAIRDGRTGSASQSSSLRVASSPADPHRGAPPVVAPVAAVLPPAEPVALASALAGNAASARLRLPRVPPVAGMEFVSIGGGAVRAQDPPFVAAHPAPSAVDETLPYLVEGTPSPVRPHSRGNAWAAMAAVGESSRDPVGAGAGSSVSSPSSRRVFAGRPT
ncbi:unnamed protein product [Closterium sp. NIES-54]